MEDKKNIVENFEIILREIRKNKTSSLYNDVKRSSRCTDKPQDVLKLVSSQLNTIQMADRIREKDVRHKKSNVLLDEKAASYDMALLRNKVINKFETQCVSDTQLIDVVKIAEAFDADRGVTQDLDISLTVSELEKKYNNDRLSSEYVKVEKNVCEGTKTEAKNVNNRSNVLSGNIPVIETTFVGFTEEFVIEDDKKPTNEENELANKCIEIDDNFEMLERDRYLSLSPILNEKESKVAFEDEILKERDKGRSTSPIFNVKKTKKSKSPMPLVYNLESFEKFEKIAIPLVDENTDLETAKHLINSQILDKELFLPSKSTNFMAINSDLCIKNGQENTTSNVELKFNHNINEEVTKSDQVNFKSHDFIENTSSVLEDEILFSSDEENYEHKEIQDLPFTCALETSFYEQSDILDKTMYVGFQTASNKTIQICTESFNKAKSMLNEVEANEKRELTLTELVNICDSVTKNIDPIDKCRASSPEVFKEDESNDIPDISISTLNKLAYGPIMEVNEVICKIPEVDTQFPDMSMLNASICNSSKEDNETHTEMEPNKSTYEPFSTAKTSAKDFQGFKTASNKLIKLSDTALARCQKVFQDIDLNANFDDNDHNTEIIKNTIASKHDNDTICNKKPNEIVNDDIQTDINDENILQEFENIEMSIGEANSVNQDEPAFVGFKTASRKNIEVSAKATDKAKRLFEDIDFNLDDNKLLKQNDSENKNNEQNIAKSFNNIVNASHNIGFKTASNKHIEISDQALAKTKTLFQDFELDNLEREANNKNENPYILSNDKLKFEDFVQPSTSSGFTGFNKINSGENLLSKDSLSYEKSVNQMKFGGFKTASNKNVEISEEALLKSRKIFSDIEDTDTNLTTSKNDKTIPELVKFETANHKPVHILTAALEKSKKKFQEDILEFNPDIIKNEKSIPKIVGFQTANQKPVSISSAALEKSKKMFQDLELLDDRIDSGVKSSYVKDVHKSEDIGLKAKQMLSNSDFSNPGSNFVDKSSGFKGFQTASKKDVKVSKQALEKCRNLFQDIDFSDNFCDNTNSMKNEVIGNEKRETVSGFKTASNKIVSVSSAALARSKRLFEEIDDQNNDNNLPIDENAVLEDEKFGISSTKSKIDDLNVQNNIETIKIPKNNFGGFKTASNKQVRVSEVALAKTKQIFKDIDGSENKENGTKADEEHLVDVFENQQKRFKISNDLKYTIPDREKINDVLDTQVLNNLENTMHTEDFHQELTRNNKRSGSPILSCPRAKRRRFETPYKLNQKVIQMDIPETVNQEKISIFAENYKKNKLYRLKDLQVDKKETIDEYKMNFDFENLLNLEFFGKRNDFTAAKMNIESLKDIFLSAVNRKLVPKGWLENHIKLILWKLICYEVKYPKVLGVVCTVRNVLNQLKYRYDRELYSAERPALRKILEKDDVPSKTMVLCVVAVYDGGVKVDCVATTANNVELLLTDGWYTVMACVDKMLARLVRQGKITVGTKIVTNGAELLNCEQGVAPWEDSSAVRLKIFGNSTRRARWDARLGYHGNAAILTQLSDVKIDGGKVSKLRLYVTRVYPALYVEKFDDGSTVTRSERLEHLHQIKYEAERQALMERLYEEVEKEFSDQDSQDSEGSSNKSIRKTSLQSGSQIFEALKRSRDICDITNHLTSSQTKLLEEHTNKRRERLLERVQARLTEKMEKNGLRSGRNVVTVLKVRVAGLGDRDQDIHKGLLSIWKPNDAIIDLIKEDSWIEVMNVVPTAIRYSEIQLSAGRQAVFLQSKYKETDKIKPYISRLKRKCYTVKELNSPITTECNEVDTAGIIFLIEPSSKEFSAKSQFQNVYLADKDCSIVCINFWGGLNKFGYQILDTGQVVACINLQKRAGANRSVPQYRVTEFSYFTKTPKNSQARNIVDSLNRMSVLDRRRICEECVRLKDNFTVKCNENVTPYRINNELPKNKAFLDSIERVHSEFNLTGLDFESTFKQQEELSPKTLKRKKDVNNRINKLKMYGEPPPLSTIHIINKSTNAMNSYKSPLTNTVSASVARVQNILNISRNSENTPVSSSKRTLRVDTSVASDKKMGTNSPVTSLNKTYVKSSVNPVKLNFDSNTSDSVDQFAEEFDPSPPLSLE